MKNLPATAADLRDVIGRLRRRLREQAPPGDLTWSQISALGHLYRMGQATVTELALLEGMRPQSMGAIITVLENAGLLVALSDPADGRKKVYSPNEDCRRLIEGNRAQRDDWLVKTIQNKFSPEEQQRLSEAVELLARLADA
ncbi:MarR family winged helix-turn-helix transcriptional regulator [Pantoea sp. BAV 3049]|uniref:MarR family winged helix-turn-helix transcriptional regulator n=1 Tax=Pantoea sp. BAV 3049 TaxID=2654188 RepID=UPI00131ABB47|nr:MarR family transcriptional regulator [Pantoea sp. BAV 3049]